MEAFSELYAATYEKQYNFAYNYMKDQYLAQDALQETYISALKNIKTLKEGHLVVAWLNQINFRVCYNMKKQQLKFETISAGGDNGEINVVELIEAPDGSPENQVVEIENNKYVMDQILQLPFTESQCILLKYYENKSIAEIADQLDISKSSVKRYTAMAQQRLKNILKDQEVSLNGV